MKKFKNTEKKDGIRYLMFMIRHTIKKFTF